MGRFYCDYCDVYLSHNAPRVRRDHMSGWRHALQVRAYYNIVANQDRMLRTMGELARDYDAAGEAMPVPLPVNMQPPQSAKLPVDVMAAAGMAPRHLAVVHELPSLRTTLLRARSQLSKRSVSARKQFVQSQPRDTLPPASRSSERPPANRGSDRSSNFPRPPFGSGSRRDDGHSQPFNRERPPFSSRDRPHYTDRNPTRDSFRR